MTRFVLHWSKLVGCSALLMCGAALVMTAEAKKIDGDQLLDPSRLVEIRVELSPQDWNQLCAQAPNAQAFFGGPAPTEDSYTYFKADLWIDGTKIESVGVRKKGFFGSNDNQRPSLKIKFDEFEKQDPVKGLDRLTLNNNKQDKALVSQLLTYEVFRSAGIHAPRSNLAKVTVNGEYLGIYSNVESIKKPFLKRHFSDTSGNLYEGTLTDFHPRALDKIEVKTNEKQHDLSDIKRLADVLAAEGDLDLDELEEILDLDYFIRYWALESLLGFWDGYAANQNNFYLYFDPQNGKGYFIPWGADWVMTAGGPFGGPNQQTPAVYAQAILAHRLYRTPGIPERYQATMTRLLDEVWNEEKMLAEIDRVEKLVTPHLSAIQRDTPQAMDQTRAFIRARQRQVRAELARGPVSIPAEPRKPAYTVAVGELSGTFSTAFTEQPATGSDDTSRATLKLILDDKPVKLDQTRVTAQVFRFPQFGPGGPGGFGRGGPGAGPPGRDAEPPISLTLSGTDAESGEIISVAFMIDRTRFESGSEPIEVSGTLTQGRAGGGFGPGGGGFGPGGGGFGPGGGFGGGAPRRSVTGQLILNQAGTSEGAIVAGSLDLSVVETHGGLFGGGPPAGGGGQAGFGRGGFGGGQGRGGFGPGPGRGGFGAPPMFAFQRVLDQDGDGTLSAEEIAAASEALRQLDADGDGVLSTEELIGAPQRPRGRGNQ